MYGLTAQKLCVWATPPLNTAHSRHDVIGRLGATPISRGGVLTALYFRLSLYSYIGYYINYYIREYQIGHSYIRWSMLPSSFWWFKFETEWLRATIPAIPWLLGYFHSVSVGIRIPEGIDPSQATDACIGRSLQSHMMNLSAHMEFCLSYILQSANSIIGTETDTSINYRDLARMFPRMRIQTTKITYLC